MTETLTVTDEHISKAVAALTLLGGPASASISALERNCPVSIAARERFGTDCLTHYEADEEFCGAWCLTVAASDPDVRPKEFVLRGVSDFAAQFDHFFMEGDQRPDAPGEIELLG